MVLFQSHGSQSASFCGTVFRRLHSVPFGPAEAQGGSTALPSCSTGFKADTEILRRQLQRIDARLCRLGRLSLHPQQLPHQERRDEDSFRLPSNHTHTHRHTHTQLQVILKSDQRGPEKQTVLPEFDMNPQSTSRWPGTSVAAARPQDVAQGMGTGPAAAGAAVSKTKLKMAEVSRELFEITFLLGGCGGCGGCGKNSRPSDIFRTEHFKASL